jgi:hypothetical protein
VALDLSDKVSHHHPNGSRSTCYRATCDLCRLDRGYLQKNCNTTFCKSCAKLSKRQDRLVVAKHTAKEHNGECLSERYVGVMYDLKWRCEVGHYWAANYNNVVNNGTWCKECSLKEIPYNTLSLSDAAAVAIERCGTCLSDSYISARIPMCWKCQYGHVFDNSLCNIKAGSWCPRCLRKTEEKVRAVFEELYGKSFPTVRPDFLKNPKTGFNLELDGYNEELGIAFEYDGEYHYIEHFSGIEGLDKRRARDTLKDFLCKKNNITLYRVPFTASKNLRDFIKNSTLR